MTGICVVSMDGDAMIWAKSAEMTSTGSGSGSACCLTSGRNSRWITCTDASAVAAPLCSRRARNSLRVSWCSEAGGATTAGAKSAVGRAGADGAS